MTYFNFEKLTIWNDARLLVKDVYKIRSNFLKKKYLVLQIS